MDNFERTIITDTNAIYLGVPIDKLMEKAGEGIAIELVKKYGKNKSYNFICGLGNNGGDGFSAARHLAKLGVGLISIYLIGRVGDLKSSAARTHWEKLKNSKYASDGIVTIISNASAKEITQADVSVECLVGTGIKDTLYKRYKDVVTKLTKQKTKIVAVDVPVPGYKHDLSISMLYPKTSDAIVIDIGMPKEAELYCGPGDVKVLEVPNENSYKSQNGELFVFGGSHQFHGAPIMAIKVASKFIGSVFFYTTPENRAYVNKIKSLFQEFIVTDDNNIERYAGFADAFLIGPGLEENLPTKAIITQLLEKYKDTPTILDAYAMATACEKPELLKNKILTPHRGELRHIFCNEPVSNLKGKGLEGKLKRFCIENGCYIVLKGSTDILFNTNGEIALNKTGNAGMAKGGTGDILVGIMSALLTKNEPWQSMRAATFINGKAGDNLAKKVGYNFSATDLIKEAQEVTKWAQDFPQN
jgi:NAD(P)H-hydrate epimerase